ncbi:hypothetical protein ASE06_07010 [Sphingopyxis sp. Root214]|uniref:SDR family NAD(P)-dependent oxidoreductase n=1 Tax=unclassified Sphingopyxis TaxID=2614943 RepID=UPI0006FFBB37|nr:MULTISPECIES: SDR family oxidoreductase [unclassified Sphingopyxis]KQZ76525.1 hypothetical protein ASD73_00985 [Sphingopyxis sp. Root154]KRC09588.1 hypothetical protein ASE06_07010 [Sphingopyxis sp. Root214]
MGDPLFDLTGRAIVVTGAASGIGIGMVEGLTNAGARVAGWDLPGPALEQLQLRLADKGQGIAVPCDIRDEKDVAVALDTTVAALGPVTGCFANAGIGGPRKSVANSSVDDWQPVLRTNVEGTLLTLRAVAQSMIAAQCSGTLVGTSSLAAESGAAGSAAYGASKGAVQSLMRALAVELAPHGIRAHSILPGWIETNMTATGLADQRIIDNVLRRIPMSRWGSPSDFSGLAVYLMSDASRYQTGGSFVVDGGYSIF